MKTLKSFNIGGFNVKKLNQKEEPTIAPGIDNDEELEQKATKAEKEKGEYTEVTTLTLDDFD
jgi:hypothetical protein